MPDATAEIYTFSAPALRPRIKVIQIRAHAADRNEERKALTDQEGRFAKLLANAYRITDQKIGFQESIDLTAEQEAERRHHRQRPNSGASSICRQSSSFEHRFCGRSGADSYLAAAISEKLRMATASSSNTSKTVNSLVINSRPLTRVVRFKSLSCPP